MTDSLPSMRMAHMAPYIDVLELAGAPIERLLLQAKLPLYLDELYDHRIASRLWFDFVNENERSSNIDSFSWEGARRFELSQFHPGTVSLVKQSPTAFGRAFTLLNNIKLEATPRPFGFRIVGSYLRIFCDPPLYAASPDARAVEYLNLSAVIETLRTICGQKWYPVELTLTSTPIDLRPIESSFPHTRIKVGQSHSSVLVPLHLLADPDEREAVASFVAPAMGSVSELSDTDLAISLRRLMQPYLGETKPSIEIAADVAGLSVRTLQRRLANAGTSYRRLLDVARYERAVELLRDPQHNVIDIAYAVGYTDPSNFARSFRRIGGLSPRAHRRVLNREPLTA